MNSPQGISKKPSDNPSLDFQKLREEGMQLIQALSGGIWTDYNLHDPGVTTLEVLCYALTELGYRAEILKEAFEEEESLDTDFIDSYFFRNDELLPHLPLTKFDFENFIEKNHSKVISAWFEQYPILHTSGTISGGYEIAVLLAFDEQFGNLNTDVTHIPLKEEEAILDVIFFDENNQRMQWGDIKKIESCRWKKNDPDNYFVFEKFNCQIALTLGANFPDNKSSTVPIRARVTFNPPKEGKNKIQSIEPYRDAIIQKLESPEFLNILTQALSKEHHKAQLLNDIRHTLLPCRNLCEDFIALRVVNEQEIKIEAEIVLDDYAPNANKVINTIYEKLDAFLLQMMLEAKQPVQRLQKNILYASNFLEVMVKIEGVEAANIINLNLFIDGIPTIPLQDETSFECIHLLNFAHYVPKISREKSSIHFFRSGVREITEEESVSKEFRPQKHSIKSERPAKEIKTERTKPQVLNKKFFEELRYYHTIQNDFPQNYRLREGQLSGKAPEILKVRVRQFKAFLLFFERILVGYLEQLYQFPELMSVKQKSEISENELQLLKRKLPDLDLFRLVDEYKWANTASSPQENYNNLLQQDKILDHLLARFSTSHTPINAEISYSSALEKSLQAKKILLKDIPLITKERGLGLPIRPEKDGIWEKDLLSGFQKRMYRLLGVNNYNLRHLQLSKISGNDPAGFYLVEHILLIERKEDNIFSKKFNRAAGLLLEYISKLSEVEKQYDPYSFQMTIIIPEWYSTWHKRSNTVENSIKKETPAHILPHFHWLNKKSMAEYEILYEDWLEALLQLYKT